MDSGNPSDHVLDAIEGKLARIAEECAAQTRLLINLRLEMTTRHLQEEGARTTVSRHSDGAP